jgi:hypothetical protein
VYFDLHLYIMQENVKALYTDRRYLELISRQHPAELQDDLKHFILIELDKYVTKKGFTGDCFPLACGVVRNQVHSDKSKFFREYRKAQTAGRTIQDMPESLTDKMEAIIQTILAGKPVYETFHHRAVTLPMQSLRMQAEYAFSRQSGLFKRSCVVAAIPVVIFMDAHDSDQMSDRLDEVQAFTGKLLGQMVAESVCVVEVGEIQVIDSKIV